MRLLLVRHGATSDNEQKRYTGQSDVALSMLGEQQAQALGEHLAGVPLNIIVTSDLQRARATTEAIALYHTIPVYEDVALRELSRGEWEGATYEEVKARDAALLKRWKYDPVNCRIPGGETLFQLRDRILNALKHYYTLYPEGTVLWVTHAGVIQALLCSLLDVNMNLWRQFYRGNASVTEVNVSYTGEILTGKFETFISSVSPASHVPFLASSFL